MLSRWMLATRAERREVAALLLVTVAVAFFSRSLPRRIALADVLLVGAVLLLLQGLVRDAARLARSRRTDAAASGGVQCVCIESTVGVGAIVAGTVLLFAWTPLVLSASRVSWTVGVAALGGFGFLTKDVVFDWKERRFGRDRTHRGRLHDA